MRGAASTRPRAEKKGGVFQSETETRMQRAEDAYKPALEEISRRAGAAAEVSQTMSLEMIDATQLPKLREQEWVLLTLGTSVLAPRPVDKAHPALRVYGAFARADDAAEHAQVVKGCDPACSLVRLRTHSWIMMPQSQAALDGSRGAQARLEEKLAARRAERAEERRRFDEAVAEHKEHEQRTLPQREWTEEDEETQAAENDVYKPPKRLRAGAEVRQQGAVVLSVIPDRSGEGECIFCVLGCHETAAEAHEWIKANATDRAVETDLVVASTCDWIYPNGADETENEFYRNRELQKIMDASKSNTEGVQRYKKWEQENALAS